MFIMSEPDERLADFLPNKGNESFYKQMDSLDDDSLKKAIQHSNLTQEEIVMYSDYLMIAENMNLPWLREVTINEVLMKKSQGGWLVKIKAGILQRISQSVGDMGDMVGQVSTDIKEAFSG